MTSVFTLAFFYSSVFFHFAEAYANKLNQPQTDPLGLIDW